MSDGGRKQDFLDVAEALFGRQGYERTTINEIIGELDVSKGAFYHYFSSKDDVLTAVAERHIAGEVEITLAIAQDAALAAPAKVAHLINQVVAHNLHTMDKRRRISSLFEHEGNARLLRLVVEKKLRAIHPAYAAIIKQGVCEGAFATDFPEEVAEQIVNLLQHLNSVIARMSGSEKAGLLPVARRKVLACEEFVGRLLGSKPGGISLDPILQLLPQRIL